MTERVGADTPRTDRVVVRMLVAISIAATAVPLLWGGSALLDRAFNLDSSVMNAVALVAIWLSITATVAAGGLVGVALVASPRTRKEASIASTLGALAGATPMSIVLFFRFQYPGCVGFNFFGVPWPEPLQTIAQIVTVGVIIGTLALTVLCFVLPRLRWVSAVVIGWLLFATVPSFIVFFLSVYGDPGPGCIVR